MVLPVRSRDSAVDGLALPQHQHVPNGDGARVGLRLHIVIVGGGIGGLSAAYCLGRAGHRITVLERASDITDVGAGIQVTALTTENIIIDLGLKRRRSGRT
jgi:salicylate hydroxylase